MRDKLLQERAEIWRNEMWGYKEREKKNEPGRFTRQRGREVKKGSIKGKKRIYGNCDLNSHRVSGRGRQDDNRSDKRIKDFEMERRNKREEDWELKGRKGK